MAHCQNNIGAAYFKTPRETVRGFVNLLSMLEQYPDKKWQDFINHISIEEENGKPGDVNDQSNELTSFTL